MSFTARYDGICPGCNNPILEGDLLEWVDGSAEHVDCVSDPDKKKPARPTCPRCWEIVAVNGACGCDPE